jgi:hypothetical protein
LFFSASANMSALLRPRYNGAAQQNRCTLIVVLVIVGVRIAALILLVLARDLVRTQSLS